MPPDLEGGALFGGGGACLPDGAPGALEGGGGGLVRGIVAVRSSLGGGGGGALVRVLQYKKNFLMFHKTHGMYCTKA